MNNEVDNDGSCVEESRKDEAKKGWRKALDEVGSWMAHKDKDKWLKQMRGNLALIATLISTMTFQIALNPPGGVRPVRDDGDKKPDVIACSPMDYGNGTIIYADGVLNLCPGESVLAFTQPDKYLVFLRWNSISFVASLSVLLLLVSGLPLNHRFPMWFLSICMCLTLTSLAFTYIIALDMVTPDPVWDPAHRFQKCLIYTWVSILSLLAFFLTLRITIRGIVVFCNKDKEAITPKFSKENTPPA